MLPTRYLEPIILVFHCLRLDNWHAIFDVVNLRMFMASLVYKEQFCICMVSRMDIVCVI